MKCKYCEHDLYNHTFSEDYTGCDLCHCETNIVEVFTARLAELEAIAEAMAKQLGIAKAYRSGLNINPDMLEVTDVFTPQDAKALADYEEWKAKQ